MRNAAGIEATRSLVSQTLFALFQSKTLLDFSIAVELHNDDCELVNWIMTLLLEQMKSNKCRNLNAMRLTGCPRSPVHLHTEILDGSYHLVKEALRSFQDLRKLELCDILEKNGSLSNTVPPQVTDVRVCDDDMACDMVMLLGNLQSCNPAIQYLRVMTVNAIDLIKTGDGPSISMRLLETLDIRIDYHDEHTLIGFLTALHARRLKLLRLPREDFIDWDSGLAVWRTTRL